MKIIRMALVFSCMALVPSLILPAVVEAQATHKEHAKGMYFCPMHPDYTSDRPGSCPICGMDLVKKEPAKPADAASQATSSVSAGVRINFDKQQLIGVKTDEVKLRHLVVPIRASARVVMDQELYDAQIAYLKQNITLSKYWNTSYQKLIALGMSESEIDALKKRRVADEGLIAIGPSDKGHFYRTPHPGSSWVYAAVFENDIGLIHPRQSVELTAAALPGETLQGMVAGVAQVVDPQSRTLRVRIRVEDKTKRLRPEMFLAATINADLGEKLSVPTDAVLDSGTRQIVYVVTGDTFAPRPVTLGVRAGGFVEVKDGLKAQDKVVVGGNFLVDAESRLKGVIPVAP